MKTKTLLLILALAPAISLFANPPAEEGKVIFLSRCAACHNINKVLTGPALSGVDQRHTIDWIVNFVHSSQSVINGGDQAAVALFEKFNRIRMPDHRDLSADNIKNIVAYIKTESSTAPKTPVFRPGKVQPYYTPLTISNYGYFLTYLLTVLLLIGGLLLWVHVKEIERREKK
jgi:cytochrome c551/c552